MLGLQEKKNRDFFYTKMVKYSIYKIVMVGQNKTQLPHTGNDQDTRFCITYKLYSESIYNKLLCII